jgi:NAD-dependent SIR2 family protein deacetylase
MDNQVVVHAAECVRDADFLLIVAGAGMGKDSGLATFEDTKNRIDAYSNAELTYEDFASPEALSTLDHDLVYGYWGNSFNAYNDASPHEGYNILSRWCEGSLLGKREQVDITHSSGNTSQISRYFIWTTNVDSQFRRTTTTIAGNSFSFGSDRIMEQHGAFARWQCGRNPCCSPQVWEAPAGFRFNVTGGSGELYRAASTASTFNGFGANHPRCISCQDKARPNVLFFGDDDYIEAPEASATYRKYVEWRRQVIKYCKDGQGKLCVIELGCGLEVPSARGEIDRVIGDVYETGVMHEQRHDLAPDSSKSVLPTTDPGISSGGSSGGSSGSARTESSAVVVRINPSAELLDFEQEPARSSEHFMLVQCGAREGLQRIAQAMASQGQVAQQGGKRKRDGTDNKRTD